LLNPAAQASQTIIRVAAAASRAVERRDWTSPV